MNADEVNDCLVDTQNSALEQYREDLQITGFYYYYQFGIQEGLKGAETYIKQVSQDYINLMCRLQDSMIREVCRKNLIIETNPSSNVLIGTFKDYYLHPIFRFYSRKLLKSTESQQTGEQIQLNVCVNTDDLGVFDTNLEFEYALLYEALQKRREHTFSDMDVVTVHPGGGGGYSDHDILEYLDDLRKMGLRAVFAKNMI